jgi:hypothetical protein
LYFKFSYYHKAPKIIVKLPALTGGGSDVRQGFAAGSVPVRAYPTLFGFPTFKAGMTHRGKIQFL